MNASDLAVVLGGLALIAVLGWYFFGPRTATHAKAEGGRQVVDITVKGGYSPNLVRVEAGTPVRLRFDRQDNSDRTSRVVFPDFRRSVSLAAFGTTTLDLDIDEPGEYSWACGMNMLHGTVIAEPPGGGRGGVLQGKAGPEQASLAATETLVDDAVEAARGVTKGDRETARAVGVGPRLDPGWKASSVSTGSLCTTPLTRRTRREDGGPTS